MPSSPAGAAGGSSLSHLDARGAARMVDVSERPASVRQAQAEGYLTMAPSTLALVRDGQVAKGDVLAVARVAAIQAAKRTWELIPLCHPLPLSGVAVEINPTPDGSGLRLEACARTTASTGVEMEALTAVQVGLLTLYDMLKAVDPAMEIGPVRLLSKSGGRQGNWRHPGLAPTDQGEGAPGADALDGGLLDSCSQEGFAQEGFAQEGFAQEGSAQGGSPHGGSPQRGGALGGGALAGGVQGHG